MADTDDTAELTVGAIRKEIDRLLNASIEPSELKVFCDSQADYQWWLSRGWPEDRLVLTQPIPIGDG